MPKEFRWANAYTGGGVGALDKIDGAYLEDLEAAIVVTGTMATFHSLDDDLSGAESVPSVINPDANAGTKSWSLVGITVPNTGLHILDTDASHDLIIAPGSDLSADRTLTLTTGDADRTLTIDEDMTASAYVKEADFNADTFLYASSDNIPVATSPANVMAALSGHAAAAFGFNSQNLTGVGSITALGQFSFDDITVDTSADYTHASFYVKKTAGATDNTDHLYGNYTLAELSQAGGNIGSFYGGLLYARMSAGTSALLVGQLATADLNAGTVTTDAIGLWANVDQEPANTVSGNICGIKVTVDADGTVTGNTYLLYLDAASNVDYAIYSVDDIPSYLGGDLNIQSHDGATGGLSLGSTLVTASAAELNAVDGISANGTSFIQAADYAAMMALLSGTATAAFDFNSQNLTGVGTLTVPGLAGADPATHKAVYYNTTTKSLFYDNT